MTDIQTILLSSLSEQSVYASKFLEREFRKQLKKDFEFPVKQEFHTMRFLSDKDPYHGKYSPEIRKEILTLFCEFMSVLEVKAIN